MSEELSNYEKSVLECDAFISIISALMSDKQKDQYDKYGDECLDIRYSVLSALIYELHYGLGWELADLKEDILSKIDDMNQEDLKLEMEALKAH